MKSQASEALNPKSLQSQNRLRQKFESPIKPLEVLHGRRLRGQKRKTAQPCPLHPQKLTSDGAHTAKLCGPGISTQLAHPAFPAPFTIEGERFPRLGRTDSAARR